MAVNTSHHFSDPHIHDGPPECQEEEAGRPVCEKCGNLEIDCECEEEVKDARK